MHPYCVVPLPVVLPRTPGEAAGPPATAPAAPEPTSPGSVPPGDVAPGLQRVWAELIDRLSRREVEVLQELVDGHSFADAAGNLFVSRHTFRTHSKNILAKLGVHSSLEAVSVAARAGMRPRS